MPLSLPAHARLSSAHGWAPSDVDGVTGPGCWPAVFITPHKLFLPNKMRHFYQGKMLPFNIEFTSASDFA